MSKLNNLLSAFNVKKIFFKESPTIERDSFLEVLIEVSFKTSFEVWYSDEFDVVQKIKIEGNKYSKLIYIGQELKSLSFRIFIQNPNRYENEKLFITILQNEKILDSKKYTISNYLPYDGWFIFEKKI